MVRNVRNIIITICITILLTVYFSQRVVRSIIVIRTEELRKHICNVEDRVVILERRNVND